MDKNNERVVFVYTTHPSVVEAERIGRELVERRLCACVNILPGMVSLYWRQGAVERGEDVLDVDAVEQLTAGVLDVVLKRGVGVASGPVTAEQADLTVERE